MVAVAEVLTKIVDEKTWTIKDFIESQRGSLTSGNAGEREGALECLSSLVKQLPDGLLSDKENIVLMEYFATAMENAGLAYSACITAIHTLILRLLSFPFGSEHLIYDKIFGENQVRQQSQNDRYTAFQILDCLLARDFEAFLTFNDDLVLGFIQSAQGEVDPHCLMVVFRLFYFISKNFNLGLFVDDFFEVVACYYPIEFISSGKDPNGITRDRLVSACEDCLLSLRCFGPYTYQLIVEKLMDDDVKESLKVEARACSVFSCDVLRDQLDDILGGIRMVAFDPTSRNAGVSMPEPVLKATEALIFRLLEDEEGGVQAVVHLCDDLIENCEPFVLEADLGLTKRTLELFEVLACSSRATSRMVVETAFKWLLQLTTGGTVHTIADPHEVMASSADWFINWCRIAYETGNSDTPLRHYKTFLKVLYENDSISKTVRHSFCKTFLPLIEGDTEFASFCKSLFDDCISDIMNPVLRVSSLSFVRELARNKWETFKSLFLEIVNSADRKAVFTICCLSVHDDKSAAFALPYIADTLACPEGRTPSVLDSLLEVFSSNHLNETLCSSFFKSVLPLLIQTPIKNCHVALACVLQDIGLTFSSKFHHELVAVCYELLRERPELITIFYLFFIQTQDVEILQNVIGFLKTEDGFNNYLMLLSGAIANKALDVKMETRFFDDIATKVTDEEKIRWRGQMCKMLLLKNNVTGLHHLEKLFIGLKNELQSNTCLEALADVLDFESRHSNPEKCKYNCSILWRQRIFCQFVSVYLAQYEGTCVQRTWFLRLLSPLLFYAEKISAFVTMEFQKLLPVLYDLLETNLDNIAEDGVLKTLSYYLNSNPEIFSSQFVSKIVFYLKERMGSDKSVLNRLYAIKCLEAVIRHPSSRELLLYRNEIIFTLTAATGSNKRILRSAAANAKNLWLIFADVMPHYIDP